MLTKAIVVFIVTGALSAPAYAAPLGQEEADGVTILAKKKGNSNGNGRGNGNGGGKGWGSCK